ncbi:unnamed protein product [Sphagnum balticum]
MWDGYTARWTDALSRFMACMNYNSPFFLGHEFLLEGAIAGFGKPPNVTDLKNDSTAISGNGSGDGDEDLELDAELLEEMEGYSD